MKFIGQVSLKIAEEPGKLEFLVIRRIGWLGILADASLLIFFVWMAWYSQNYLLLLAFGFAVLVILTDLLQGRNTRLTVTSVNLAARGNLRNLTSTRVEKSTMELQSFGFYTGGGRHSTPGLYADGVLLLPGLDRRQAAEILAAVRTRFPEFKHVVEPLAAGIFGASDEVLALNLGGRHGSGKIE